MTAPNQDVRKLILEATGHVLVTGGPGSGKTTIALRKAMCRIESGLLAGQSVLFLSFSRAAVARIAQASETEMPAVNKKQLSIQTFHSFCWDLLRSHAYLLGAPRKLQILLPHDEKALSGGIKSASSEWAAWEIERERLFREDGRAAFDLFAPKAAELLARSALIRDLLVKQFPMIIVDEAQDTGPEAWRCIEILAPYVQIICLADLEQQIFDYLPGVGPERIDCIGKALNPLRVDLGGENNRSPGTEITAFANDVLACKVRSGSYIGVKKQTYNPKTFDYKAILRISLGRVWKEVEEKTGKKPESCAILATRGTTVAQISAALNSGDKPIAHKVFFDEAEVLLASRLVAFLLEPKHAANIADDISQCLQILADMKRATGTKTALQDSVNLTKWAAQTRQGNRPKAKVYTALEQLITEVQNIRLTGVPEKDWLIIKRILRASNCEDISVIAEYLDYLVAFNRGKRIAANLSAIWSSTASYQGARNALDEALTQDWILSGIDDLSGIHVLTIHRSKGKQFDAVIIFGKGEHGTTGLQSSLVWNNDPSPHRRSRKIFRVAITRARCHVLIVMPAYPRCPIVSPYTL